MLVATPGQTAAYSTLHNSGNTTNSNTTTTTGPLAKKSTLSNVTSTATGTPKSLNNNNNNNHNLSSSSTNTTNNSYNHQNHKNDNNTTTISSKDLNSSTTHSLKTENSTKQTTNFIQTLKDSVQKALISTTGGNNSLTKHNNTNNLKIQNCNNSATTTKSLQNVTSSTTATNNAKAANAAAAATTSSSISTNSANAVASTSSASSLSLVRNKYSSCSLSKLHTVAPTILHRYPEERQHASSTDSLQKEMCHFKPIRTAPTTPWKSGSKSRGSSLRFPKANLAMKKTEFILKSNCDVNNRKKKQQQQKQEDHTDDDDEDDDNEDEQENKEFYGIYKPKPSSTFLSTTVANHQSAFVCLVAQMKNLVNIQSKKIITSSRGVVGAGDSSLVVANVELTNKTKSTRTANRPTKNAAANIVSITNNTCPSTNTTISNAPNKKTKSIVNLPVKQKTTNKPLNQVKKVDLPKELIKTTTTRSTRLSVNANKNEQQQQRTTPTPTEIEVKIVKGKSSKVSQTAGITKAKSRRKLGSAKTKNINIKELASTIAKDKLYTNPSAKAHASAVETSVPQQQINRRKRKILQDDVNELSTTQPTTDSTKFPGKARKSVRLSKDICANSNQLFKNPIVLTKNQIANSSNNNNNSKHLNPQRSGVCFSPPLTRSRLKQLNQQQQGKIVANSNTIEIKKRKV